MRAFSKVVLGKHFPLPFPHVLPQYPFHHEPSAFVDLGGSMSS